MSMWGGGYGAQTVNPQNIAMAEQELEMVTDLFNRIVESCYKKCIPTPYHDGDLNKGESVCIDRCVSKFFDVNIKVGEKMQKMGGQAGGMPGQ